MINTLALDGSSPAVVGFTTAVAAKATAAFSPPDGSLLVAFVAGGAQASTSIAQTAAMTDSVGLTWTRYARSNTLVAAALSGTAEMWWAPCPTKQAGMTVTATFGQSPADTTPAGLLRVGVFTGAAMDQSTAATGTQASSASLVAYSINVTTTVTGSWVWGTCFAWSSATSPTAATGCTIDSTELDASSGDGSWAVKRTAVAGAPGSVNIGATAPTTHLNAVAAEILPAWPGPGLTLVGVAPMRAALL